MERLRHRRRGAGQVGSFWFRDSKAARRGCCAGAGLHVQRSFHVRGAQLRRQVVGARHSQAASRGAKSAVSVSVDRPHRVAVEVTSQVGRRSHAEATLQELFKGADGNPPLAFTAMLCDGRLRLRLREAAVGIHCIFPMIMTSVRS